MEVLVQIDRLSPRVGGLLSKNKLYPYMYRGVAANIDEIIENGSYVVSAGVSTNLPTDAYSYGVLEVFGGESFIAQRYTPHSNYSGNYGEYTRVRYKEDWGNWRFIAYSTSV